MGLKVYHIKEDEEKQVAFEIRRVVFVEGQGVPQEEEYDEYDQDANHYLAVLDRVPVGTARWRYKGDEIKLERFAVLEKHRNKGIGSALLNQVLKDIPTGKSMLLHAQLDAVSLYERAGFRKVGDLFMECNIAHYKMVK